MRRVPAARRLLLAAMLLAGCSPAQGAGQDLDSARQAWRTGRYAEAISAYAGLAGQADATAAVHRERARLLAEVGRYEEAERTLAGAAQGPAAGELATVQGEVYLLTGKLSEAEAAFRRAVEANAPDREAARLELANLLWRRGQRDEALAVYDGYIDLYNAARDRLGLEELMAVGDAVRYLGVRDPALFGDALHAYDRAAARDPSDPRPLLRTGELFLDKYQAPDAHASFDQVLGSNPHHPRALLGKARVLDFDGDVGQATERVQLALETNPDFPEARTFLARLHLKLEEYDEAMDAVEHAIRVNPASLEAISVLAGVHYVRGDRAAYEATRDRALALNPRYPDVYNTVASLAIDHRQYHEGVALARQAVTLDSLSWWGWGILGMNQLRIGQMDEGRSNIERAFKGDPHNVWLFNTLELTDTFDRFRTVRTQHFELFLHGREADLLEPYVVSLAEEAYEALRTRYGAEPPLPIRLEIFPSHGDFSVRTLGLVGLGALGVSFGSVLVMDSPSARPAGEFNWASTLWHELAHAFHLGMTDHHVPRWFSEGLAVHEQRLAREHWGFRAGVGFLQAYQQGRLNPVSQLNHGFVRPTYPEQVVHSYLQSSLVFEMIEAEHGLDAILGMMRGYREGRTTEELVVSVLRTTPEALDEAFDRWFRARYARELSALSPIAAPVPPGATADQLRTALAQRPEDFPTRLMLGRRLLDDGRLDEAEEQLTAALALFPGYAGPDSPYVYLARIHRQRGDLAKAADALRAIADRDESAYAASVEEAALRRELGDSVGEARALERAVEIHPYDLQMHQRLAGLYGAQGNWAGAVRERRAALALDPVDRAGAHYELALAHFGAGDRAAARTQILRALEIAPAYAEAQDLLLRLRDGSP